MQTWALLPFLWVLSVIESRRAPYLAQGPELSRKKTRANEVRRVCKDVMPGLLGIKRAVAESFASEARKAGETLVVRLCPWRRDGSRCPGCGSVAPGYEGRADAILAASGRGHGACRGDRRTAVGVLP
jgi:hypothetical protein